MWIQTFERDVLTPFLGLKKAYISTSFDITNAINDCMAVMLARARTVVTTSALFTTSVCQWNSVLTPQHKSRWIISICTLNCNTSVICITYRVLSE